MDIMQKALDKHYEWNGKIEIVSRTKINDRESLSLAYTPGVAQPCLEIEKNPELCKGSGVVPHPLLPF